MTSMQNYNLREKLNVYGGAILGALAPIAAVRYGFFGGIDDHVLSEALKWGTAATFTSASMIPLLCGLFGLNMGHFSASELRTKRIVKERENLEHRTSN